MMSFMKRKKLGKGTSENIKDVFKKYPELKEEFPNLVKLL